MFNEDHPIIVSPKTIACYKFLWDVISIDKSRVTPKSSLDSCGVTRKKTKLKKYLVKDGLLVSELPQ